MREAINDIGILRSVLDRSPDMIALSEMSGRLLYVNQAGVALVGLAELPVGQPTSITDFFTPSALAVAGEVQSALTCSREWRGLTELKHFVTKQPIPVEIAAFVVDRGWREPSVIVSIVRDRADRHNRVRWEAVVEASEYRAAEQRAVAELSTLALDGELDQLLNAATMAASKLMGVHRSMITPNRARRQQDRGGGIHGTTTAPAHTARRHPVTDGIYADHQCRRCLRRPRQGNTILDRGNGLLRFPQRRVRTYSRRARSVGCAIGAQQPQPDLQRS